MLLQSIPRLDLVYSPRKKGRLGPLVEGLYSKIYTINFSVSLTKETYGFHKGYCIDLLGITRHWLN